MKTALSISAAWDQTKARFAADGGLFITVALALIALPSALAEFLFPSRGMMMNDTSVGELVVLLVVFVLGMVGQLALIRLALGPSVAVGEAIAHGARRVPVFLGAALILLALLFLIAIPFGFVLTAMGVSMQQGAQPSGGATLVLLIFFLLIVFFSTRLLVMSAVASIEGVGPIATLRRSWMLTAGHFGRLIGFLLLFLLGAFFAIMACAVIVRVLVTSVAGTPEVHSAGALIIALVVSLVTAAVTAVFVVMLARIYAQLAGRDLAVSVPSSGT